MRKLSGQTTSYLPFWPVQAPEPNAKFLIQYSCLFDHMFYTDSQVRSTLLNGSIVHKFIVTKGFGDLIVWAGAKTSI